MFMTNETYFMGYPSQSNALELFNDEWTCTLPGLGGPGRSALFEDARMVWAESQIGSFAGKRILECGPLEGAHSFMMSIRGAASILAIEANTRAFLRCLVVKNIYSLHNTTFLLGDFTKYISKGTGRFDVVVANGILYHMKSPHVVLADILRNTDQVVMWTHYFDKEIISGNDGLRHKFSEEPLELNDWHIPIKLYKQSYFADTQRSDFCGGAESYSYWIPKQDMLAIFEHFGFSVTIGFETPHHPHGPCYQLIAERI
jgi:hypothetical protein